MAKRRLRKAIFAMPTTTKVESNTGGADAFTLADLPTELIWRIASYLRTPTLRRNFEQLTVRRRTYDLCALRLTCQRLHDKVQHVFLPTAFETLEVDLTRSDLDMLVEIAKDSNCSAVVKELHFVMAEAWPDADDWSDEFEQEMIERDHVEKGTGAILLSRALSGFSNLRTVKIQPVMWFPGNSRFILSRWPHSEGSTTSLVATILAALSLCDTRIETLAFSRQPPFTEHLNGPTGCYINQLNIPPSSKTAFQCLKTLDLTIALRPTKRFEPPMASMLTYFVSGLTQLASLSVRFDSHILSELVMRDFLMNCVIPTLTWFRLEVAWIWDTPSGCPLVEFVQKNNQIQRINLAHVGLEPGRWSLLFETLSTCEELQRATFTYITEEMCAVYIRQQAKYEIEGIENMATKLSEAKSGLSVGNSDHDECPAHRYERYPEDSEYESSGED